MAHYPQNWFVSMDMYNELAPIFGHDPIPTAPMFPTTDQFLINYRQTNNSMTEQSLIEYAKRGDQAAIAHLDQGGLEGIDWSYAITHVSGSWLSGEDIKRVWSEMVKIHQETNMEMDEIKSGLQAALDKKHAPVERPVLAQASPAGRPWDFKAKPGINFGKRTNRTPPKKKRK